MAPRKAWDARGCVGRCGRVNGAKCAIETGGAVSTSIHLPRIARARSRSGWAGAWEGQDTGLDRAAVSSWGSTPKVPHQRLDLQGDFLSMVTDYSPITG
jgi:hypothetical protein